MNIQKAIEVSEYIFPLLLQACSRLEVVGSVKRKDKDEVHDLEMICILNGKRPVPEFGRPKEIYLTMLDKIIADLEYQDIFKPASNPANGSKLKRRRLSGEITGQLNEFCLELFIVTEKTWAIQNVIRTGPGLFSHRFVTNAGALCFDKQTNKNWRGFLPDKYKYIRGETVIMEGVNVLNLPEEADAIELLGRGWIPPNKRREFSLR